MRIKYPKWLVKIIVRQLRERILLIDEAKKKEYANKLNKKYDLPKLTEEQEYRLFFAGIDNGLKGADRLLDILD